MDIAYIVLVLVLSASTFGFIVLCERVQ